MWSKGDNAAFTFGIVLIVAMICLLFMMPARADTATAITAMGMTSCTSGTAL